MNILGQWAISLLLSSSCPTPTAWVTATTIVAVCGDEDGIPVYDARNKWAIPTNRAATQAEFDLYNDR
jgi:hypothetical protein